MLILSSCDFRNDNAKLIIIENLPKAIGDCRVLFIPNEKATHEIIVSGKYHRRLTEFGFHEDNMAVFDHTCPDAFRNLDIDLIYISGGNTFATLQKLRDTGFDKDIIRYVHNGVTYIGGSAGAHIASRDIAHVAAFDDVPDGMTDFSGLSLFDGVLICHYTDERELYYQQLQAEHTCPVYALTDNDTMIIKGEKVMEHNICFSAYYDEHDVSTINECANDLAKLNISLSVRNLTGSMFQAAHDFVDIQLIVFAYEMLRNIMMSGSYDILKMVFLKLWGTVKDTVLPFTISIRGIPTDKGTKTVKFKVSGSLTNKQKSTFIDKSFELADRIVENNFELMKESKFYDALDGHIMIYDIDDASFTEMDVEEELKKRSQQ